jgi:RNA polymerase sigma-70 factor (ECF subfamily)
MDAEFEAFFRKHKEELLRLAIGRLRILPDADEALMDAALQIYKKWPVVQAHSNPVALARKIVHSSCIDFYRRRARRDDQEKTLHESGYPRTPSADDLLEMRGFERLDQALAELEARAPKQAECVRLKFLEGCTHEEIAAHLDISAGAAKTNTHLGLKALHTLMNFPAQGKGDDS